MSEDGKERVYRTNKWLLDRTASAIALILFSPLLMIIAFLIRVRMGSPVFFRQDRGGRDGRPFTYLKFRTMTQERDHGGGLLPDEKRITGLGRFLRSTTLDELPAIWNVLKGDMSIVGPRPLLAEYVERYSKRQRTRLEVRPGLTGWAVVKGRNSLSWKERLELDVWYVENRSFWLDLRIILMTVSLIVGRKGVSSQGHATMPEFKGVNDE